MKPTPAGWPRISSAVFYTDAAKAIDWLCEVFGFEVRLRVEGEDGSIEHCELVYGEDGLIFVGQEGHGNRDEDRHMVSPRSVNGGNTQALSVFVDDADAHYAHTKAAGARIFRPLETTDYGPEYWADRTYGARDLDGHLWWFMERVREPAR
jgi:uncharacterized glyoxalase superfamily protein PhnB